MDSRPGANVNQLLQPWVTGLWLGRHTLSDEHLIGNLPGRPRLQRPAYEEPIEAGTLPTFIEIH